MVPLTRRPVLQARHQQYFERLDQLMVQRILVRMEQDHLIWRRPQMPPDQFTGRWLFGFCREQGFDHASVVFPLCRERDTIGLGALEALVGHPVRVWSPPARARAAVLRDGTPVVRPPSGTFTQDQTVLSVVPNPKKAGSATWHRFSLYRPGRTVAELMRLGVTRADLLWDMDPSRKHIVLGSREEWAEIEGG